jgi:hypothetical protein
MCLYYNLDIGYCKRYYKNWVLQKGLQTVLQKGLQTVLQKQIAKQSDHLTLYENDKDTRYSDNVVNK